MLTGFKRFHAFLRRRSLAPGRQARLAYGLGNNGQRIGSSRPRAFEPEPQASVCSGRAEGASSHPAAPDPIVLCRAKGRWARAGPRRGIAARRRRRSVLQLPAAGASRARRRSCSCWCCWRHWRALRPAPHGLQASRCSSAGEGLQLCWPTLPWPGSARAGLPAGVALRYKRSETDTRCAAVSREIMSAR